MELLPYVAVAYLMCGWARTGRDFQGSAVNRPGWSFHPTLRMGIFLTLIWPLREVMDSQERMFKYDARAIAMGSTTAAVQLAFMTLVVWFCFWVPGLWFESVLARLALAAVVLWIVGHFLFPLVMIPMLFVTSLILWPIDKLFPRPQPRPPAAPTP